MKLLTHFRDLSLDELKRVRATLRKRFGVGKRGNILEIAFGQAEKRNSPCSARPEAICFYVRHKRRPRAKADRIPELLTIRFRRQNEYVSLRLPTDVVHIARSVKATGRRIRHLDEPKRYATSGCVLVWRQAGQRVFQWGILSVGHSFRNVDSVPESNKRVRLRVKLRPSTEIEGRLLARTRASDQDPVDASIISVSKSSMIRNKVLPRHPSTSGKAVRSVGDLSQDAGRLGHTFPPRQKIAFRVMRFMPECELIPALGLQHNVLETLASKPSAFGPTRSGSLSVINRQAATVQIAGLPAFFRRGWGQSLETALGWAQGELAKLSKLRPDQIEVRFVRAI